MNSPLHLTIRVKSARHCTVFWIFYNAVRCPAGQSINWRDKECCKQCRYVKLKGTMTKWPVQKLTHRTTQNNYNIMTQQTFRKTIFLCFSADVFIYRRRPAPVRYVTTLEKILKNCPVSGRLSNSPLMCKSIKSYDVSLICDHSIWHDKSFTFNMFFISTMSCVIL